MRRIAVGGTALAAVAAGAVVLAAPGIAAAAHGGEVFAADQTLAGSPLVESASPVVLAVTPDEGTTFGGTKVTITGEGFSGATSVDFGSTTVMLAKPEKSKTKIKVVAPPGAVGSVDVTVSTPEATSAVTPSDQFTYVKSPPVLLKLSPDHGVARGDRPLTINGENFTGATAVYIGGTSVPFTLKSASVIKATTAVATNLGAEDVTVVTPEGTSEAGPGSEYFYEAEPPVLTRMSPGAGPASGGTTVILFGEGFLEASQVKFERTPVTSFKVLDDTQLEVVTPPETVAKVPIYVTTPLGTSQGLGCKEPDCGKEKKFEYDDPTVTSVEPENGPIAGGTPITIHGTGFAIAKGETEIQVGKALATSVSCSSIDVCTGVTAAGKLGAQPVIVRIKTNNPQKSSESEAPLFTYE